MILNLTLVFGVAAHADNAWVGLIQIRANTKKSIDEITDTFTSRLVGAVMSDPKSVAGETYVETPTGYQINGYLLAEISQLSEHFREGLVMKLRNIYVNGVAWRGKTYRFAPGQMGLLVRAGRSTDEIAALYGRLQLEIDQGHVTDQSCDFWLSSPPARLH